MEKLNLNFSGGDNVVKSICWIMSYLSWLLLVASGWASLKWLVQTPSDFDDGNEVQWGWTIWGFFAWRTLKFGGVGPEVDPLEKAYYPLQMQVSLYYICFILALIIITGGCFVFFFKTIFSKDDQVINGMMGQFSKFHFFPLLCASALFIIGECVDNLDKDDWLTEKRYDHFKDMHISGLIFSIIGLASFIFIYIMTDLNTNDWWVLLLLKKGVFSCLIILMWYNFCYEIYYVHYYDKITNDDNFDPDEDFDWKKGCGLAFSIILGIGSLAFSFIFKDLVACVMNLLIYIGLTVAYFRLDKDSRKHKNANKNGDGIVDIIMLVLSVAMIVLLLIKYRENCLKS